MNSSHIVKRNGDVSFWYQQAGLGDPGVRLTDPIEVDIAIVGGGLTGLWAAYYLAKALPTRRIAIFEARTIGYGASSRNGGWISYGMPGLNRMYAKSHGREAVKHFQQEVFASIAEVDRVVRAEQIEADLAYEGEIAIATAPAQAHRLVEERDYCLEWGFAEDDLQLVGETELRERFTHLPGGTSGLFSRHAARVQPAKLVRGLRDAVLRAGVEIYQNTPIVELAPHRLTTADGLFVAAQWIIRGTEGFSNELPGQQRDWLPKLSSVIATEPLTDQQLADINWLDHAVLTRDASHSFSYIQRTADNRIVLGGPGVPYYFGSGRDRNGETPAASVTALAQAFDRLFPSLPEVAFEHTWTGVLGVPRDWSGTVSVDPATGMCVAGGYVGDGLSGSNLAGRTLRDLITGADTAVSRLPWVNKRIRRWEVEPLRWLGVTGLYAMYNAADRIERTSASPKTSPLAVVAGRIAGRY